MAKTVKIKQAGTHTFEITSKTKDATYVFASEDVAKSSYLKLSNYGNTEPVYIKDNNDLLIYIGFGNEPNYQTSITIIKDYYLYCGANNNLVYIDGESVYAGANTYNYNYVAKEFTDSSASEYVFSNAGANIYHISNSKSRTHIIDTAGSDKYLVNGLSPDSAPVYVDDMAGNDYYEIINSRGFVTNDYKGNDKYIIQNCTDIISSNDTVDGALKTDLWICDYSGNDTYAFDNVVSTVGCETYDAAGNDKWTLNRTTYMYLEDDAGNDKYTADQSNHFEVYDSSGNDSYTVTKSDTVTITDRETNTHANGSDKYTVNECDHVDIDDRKGADKYTFYDASNVVINDYNTQNDNYTISYAQNVNINDRGGKETYKLSQIIGATITDSSSDGVVDNDSMTVSDSRNINITNKHGDVKYTFTNTSNIAIEDNTGKDTYTISGSYNKKTKATTFATGVSITDIAGHPEDKHNDTFNFNYVKGSNDEWTTYLASENWTITEYGGSNTYNIKQSENIKIHSDNGGYKDTYNITSCKNVYLLDEGASSDVYNVKFAQNSSTIISDKGGTGDKLTVSGATGKNVIIMSNYISNGVSASDEQGSLIIFDKKSRSYVQVQNFYHNNGGDYDTLGSGVIESIKAGGAVNATSAETIAKLNSLRSQIAGFLGDGGSVVGILNSGDNNRIDALANYVTNLYQA